MNIILVGKIVFTAALILVLIAYVAFICRDIYAEEKGKHTNMRKFIQKAAEKTFFAFAPVVFLSLALCAMWNIRF
jgi:hypothetical protein